MGLRLSSEPRIAYICGSWYSSLKYDNVRRGNHLDEIGDSLSERMQSMSTPPPEYEKKFADFIKLCADAKTAGTKQVVVGYPWVLGDTYEELIESLSRLADAGLTLHIGARKNWPCLN